MVLVHIVLYIWKMTMMKESRLLQHLAAYGACELDGASAGI